MVEPGEVGPGRAEVERARRLAEVFGEVLPAATADDRDLDGPDGDSVDEQRWYAENRPPHHDPR